MWRSALYIGSGLFNSLTDCCGQSSKWVYWATCFSGKIIWCCSCKLFWRGLSISLCFCHKVCWIRGFQRTQILIAPFISHWTFFTEICMYIFNPVIPYVIVSYFSQCFLIFLGLFSLFALLNAQNTVGYLILRSCLSLRLLNLFILHAAPSLDPWLPAMFTFTALIAPLVRVLLAFWPNL